MEKLWELSDFWWGAESNAHLVMILISNHNSRISCLKFFLVEKKQIVCIMSEFPPTLVDFFFSRRISIHIHTQIISDHSVIHSYASHVNWLFSYSTTSLFIHARNNVIEIFVEINLYICSIIWNAN